MTIMMHPNGQSTLWINIASAWEHFVTALNNRIQYQRGSPGSNHPLNGKFSQIN
jgi:hypothetical protein